MNGVAYTKMHNALCRSVTIEARFTSASSRSSGSHREWTRLHGGIWREFGDDRNRQVFGMQIIESGDLIGDAFLNPPYFLHWPALPHFWCGEVLSSKLVYSKYHQLRWADKAKRTPLHLLVRNFHETFMVFMCNVLFMYDMLHLECIDVNIKHASVTSQAAHQCYITGSPGLVMNLGWLSFWKH
jgi:hypothetical protein